jgi:hypothetical protein
MSKKRQRPEPEPQDFGILEPMVETRDVEMEGMPDPDALRGIRSGSTWRYTFNLVSSDFLKDHHQIAQFLVLRFEQIPTKWKKKHFLNNVTEIQNAQSLARYLATLVDEYGFQDKEDKDCTWTSFDQDKNKIADFVTVLGFRLVKDGRCEVYKNFEDFQVQTIADDDYESIIEPFVPYFTHSLSDFRSRTGVKPGSRLKIVRTKQETWPYAINFMPPDVLTNLDEPADDVSVLDYVILSIENVSTDTFTVLTDEEIEKARPLVEIVEGLWSKYSHEEDGEPCSWTRAEGGNVLKVKGFRLKPCKKAYTTLGKLKTAGMDPKIFGTIKSSVVTYMTSSKQQQNLAEARREGIHTYGSAVQTEYQTILLSNHTDFVALYESLLVNKKFMFPFTLSDFAGRSAFLMLALLTSAKPGASEFLAEQCAHLIQRPGALFRGNSDDAVLSRRKHVVNAFGPQMSCADADVVVIAGLRSLKQDDKVQLFDRLLTIVDGRTFWTMLRLIRPYFSDDAELAGMIDKLVDEYGNKTFSDLANTRTEIRRTEEYLENVKSKKGIETIMQDYVDCENTQTMSGLMENLLMSNVYMRIPYYDSLLSQVTLKACAVIAEAIAGTVDDLRLAIASVPLPALQCFAKLGEGRKVLASIGSTARFVQNLFVLDGLQCCKVFHFEEFQRAVRIMIGGTEEADGIRCAAANKPFLLALSSVIPMEFQDLHDLLDNKLIGIIHPDYDAIWQPEMDDETLSFLPGFEF